MKSRNLSGIAVGEIGLGCMNFNHAYQPVVTREDALDLLAEAFDLGVTHFDTAALYGFGMNEEWVGAGIKPFRAKMVLASKCGMTGVNGKRVIDGRPETLKQTCAAALKRLGVDYIDVYYLHRWDKQVPIEESVGALGELVRQGLIGAVGLSEVSSITLRKAHAVHPIEAVQNEYSLWTRDPERKLLGTCAELGIALVAFSPLGRGFLAGAVESSAQFAAGDIRRGMPRFQSAHIDANKQLVSEFGMLAQRLGCSKAQLALSWLLHRSPNVLPIFGTTRAAHLRENLAAADVKLATGDIAELDALFTPARVSGARYPADTLVEIDSD